MSFTPGKDFTKRGRLWNKIIAKSLFCLIYYKKSRQQILHFIFLALLMLVALILRRNSKLIPASNAFKIMVENIERYFTCLYLHHGFFSKSSGVG
jgi:hypothetical protein